MRAIEYLRQIKVLDDQINRNIREIERWRDMAYKITADPSEEHYNPNRPTSAPFEKCFEKADELEQEGIPCILGGNYADTVGPGLVYEMEDSDVHA